MVDFFLVIEKPVGMCWTSAEVVNLVIMLDRKLVVVSVDLVKLQNEPSF